MQSFATQKARQRVTRCGLHRRERLERDGAELGIFALRLKNRLSGYGGDVKPVTNQRSSPLLGGRSAVVVLVLNTPETPPAATW
ncbi:hypothetical protein [Methylobacterium oryzisoli]|uniref:hypothetical protein n=1 Tax=Methylobacterium oryzisoli TaxID=3385502 RepID=UPI0038911A39